MNSFASQAASVVRVAAVLCGVLAFAPHAQAEPVTQTTAPASSASYGGWDWQPLGSVILADGTNTVLGLTSTVTLNDQGWGDTGGSNGVRIDLLDNGNSLDAFYVAIAGHDSTTQTFNITDTIANPDVLTNLNIALSGIDWSTSPTVTLAMNTTPIGWYGWQLFTSDASFTVTSDSVPEPVSLALLGTGLAGLALIRKRKSV